VQERAPHTYLKDHLVLKLSLEHADTHTADRLLYTATEVVEVKCHLQLSQRYAKIRLVESVRNVPAERTELATFLHDGVEETQSVHELVERLSASHSLAVLAQLASVLYVQMHRNRQHSQPDI